MSLHPPTLRADVIDVWHLPLGVSSAADARLLDATERGRAARFRSDAARHRFVAARAALRRVLGLLLDRDPAAIALAYGPHGKPLLPDAPGLAFNVSHSHERGLLAVGMVDALGVDIELVRSTRRFEAIGNRFFATTEAAALRQLAAAARCAAFHRTWSRKEAYLKALGTGLTFPSTGFTLAHLEPGACTVLATGMAGDDAGRWVLDDVAAGPDYAAALCYPGPRRWQRHRVAGALAAPPAAGRSPA